MEIDFTYPPPNQAQYLFYPMERTECGYLMIFSQKKVRNVGYTI